MAVKSLVVDDSATMRTILEMTFAAEDAEVITVDNGQAAVQAVGHAQPDLVFADASMQGMDGYAVAHAIKANPASAGTAVIVMTSQKVPYDDAKGTAAGVDDHIVKPFDSTALIAKVASVVAGPRAAASAAPVAQPAPAARPAAPAPVAARPAAPVAPAARPAAPAARPAAPAARPAAPVAAAAAPGRAAPVAPGASGPAAPVARTSKTTASFDGGPPMAAPKPAAQPVIELDEPLTNPPPKPSAAAASAATASGGALASKLGDLGLSQDQIDGVLLLSKEVIEQVVWEVVPELAETIIREEIARLTTR